MKQSGTGLGNQLAAGLVAHRRIVLVVLFVVISLAAGGIVHLEEDTSFQEFEVGTEEEHRQNYIDENFSTAHENTTVTQVIVRDDNVFEKETLLATLELQKDIRANESVTDTLSTDRQTAGIANLVAEAVIRFQEPGVSSPTIDEKIDQLASMDQQEIDAVAAILLDDERNHEHDGFVFMPNDYESGTANASSTMVVVFQTTTEETPPAAAPDRLVDSQTAIQDIATGYDEDIIVVGDGIITAESQRSMEDSLAIVGPLALLFVLLTLAVAYRDLADVAISFLGIILVQLWTFGILGWVGIAFNPLLIAVPVLLIGLSIDYGLHVFMRYREHRATGASIGEAMTVSMAGVGVALVWVTVTTVAGFLSNLASPVVPIRELGVISAIGIVGALVVFGGFVPPLKAELDSALQRIGIDRKHRPLGANGGVVGRVLGLGSTAANTAPAAVIVAVLLLTAVTTFAAADVSTSFEPEDNIADEAPAWTDNLPASISPGEYTVKENLQFANEHYVRHDSRAEFLVEGDVTDPEVLQRVAAAEATAETQDVTVVLANGESQTTSPLTVMERVAAQNDSFDTTVSASDTTGNGVPDTDLDSVYDELYEVAPDEADRVIHRQDGEYVAIRMSVAVNSEADGRETTSQMQSVADSLDGDGQTATATGQPIINQLIQDYLLQTLLTSLAFTILAVVAILMTVFRVVHGSATLGLVTILPVVFAVSWIIGTMYVLGYPLSVLTTLVASLTIGIGIDYSIHISERFRSELADGRTIGAAITRTVQGTGAALLGSAVTTAAGFGVLAFALQPELQQFGAITAIMIAYAFLGSVFVLPSLLTVWARFGFNRPKA